MSYLIVSLDEYELKFPIIFSTCKGVRREKKSRITSSRLFQLPSHFVHQLKPFTGLHDSSLFAPEFSTKDMYSS